MPACPQCGSSEWHTHEPVVADGSPSVRLAQLIDEWETQAEKLRLAQQAASAIAARMNEIRRLAAARGVNLAAASVDPVGVRQPVPTYVPPSTVPEPIGYRNDVEDVQVDPAASFEEMGTDELMRVLQRRRVVDESQAAAGETTVGADGIPIAGVRGIASNTGGVGKTAAQIEAEEQAEREALIVAEHAGLPAQRPVKGGPSRAQRAQVAEIQRDAGEAPDDSGALRASIADRMQSFQL